MDSGKERSEITFSASFSGHKQLLEAKKAVETQFPDATISFLEL